LNISASDTSGFFFNPYIDIGRNIINLSAALPTGKSTGKSGAAQGN
jgi:hypothetical protein